MFLKKVRFLILCLAGILILSAPALQVTALSVQETHILDSLLPDHQPRAAGGGSTTTAPDPADGMPFLPGDEENDLSDRAERGGQEENRDAAREAAPTPGGEKLSIGMAVLVVGLAAISVVLAVFYVFRGKHRHGRE